MDEATRRRSAGASRRSALLLPAALATAGSAPAAQASHRHRLTLEDRAALQDLFSVYLWAFDCSDVDGFIELFTEDAILIGIGRRYETEAAMREWFLGLLSTRDAAGDAWLHEAGQFRFDGDGSRCVVYAYATHFRLQPTTRDLGVRSLGYYVNECVKVGGAWKFRRFSINRWDNTTQPWKKPKPWEAPEAE